MPDACTMWLMKSASLKSKECTQEAVLLPSARSLSHAPRAAFVVLVISVIHSTIPSTIASPTNAISRYHNPGSILRTWT
eukprot:503575-Rhodomonas_salina.1